MDMIGSCYIGLWIEIRCAIAEHVILRFPLTTPLICKTPFSAVGVTAFGSPSCSKQEGEKGERIERERWVPYRVR
jgi:hypothetical protein